MSVIARCLAKKKKFSKSLIQKKSDHTIRNGRGNVSSHHDKFPEKLAMDQPGKNRMLDVHLSRVCAFAREEEEEKRELISQTVVCY